MHTTRLNPGPSRSRRDLRRVSLLVLSTFAAGLLLWSSASVAAPNAKKAAAGKAAAAGDAMDASSDKDAADGLRLPNDPPPAKLKVQDNFSVDQPVTPELLAALNAKRPPGKQPFKQGPPKSMDPVMEMPVAK